jgi:hypothetical protein
MKIKFSYNSCLEVILILISISSTYSQEQNKDSTSEKPYNSYKSIRIPVVILIFALENWHSVQ